MNYIQTEIDGVWLIEPKVFSDERGYFMEAYKKEEFDANIGPVDFTGQRVEIIFWRVTRIALSERRIQSGETGSCS